MTLFDAVVLAGGSARRLGGVDKPALPVGRASLLERVVAAAAGAEALVVVGPSRRLGVDVTWCREDPPGSGPVAALAAALPLLTAGRVVVLAADLPWVAPAVPRLLAAAPDDGLAALVDTTGKVNHLAAVWSRPVLAAALARVPDVAGAAMRSLVGGVPLVPVLDEDGWSDDCDTWDDLAAARARATAAPPTQVTRSSPE